MGRRWPLLAVLLVVALRAGAQTQADATAWYDRTYELQEVTVEKKRERYSRKNNPAVELMRRVIAAKRRNRLELNDYYRYRRYQKLTLAANDIDPAHFMDEATGLAMLNQIEVCPYNNKLIMPLSYGEVMTEKFFRRSPHEEREVVRAERSGGVNHLLQTGDVFTSTLKDFFTDVDIYDDQVRLLQHRFTSPLGVDAIRFYRFFIVDTLSVGGDRCVHLHFTPNNQRDFGFSGDLYVVDDSSSQVRRAVLNLPRNSEVNFVNGMGVLQEFCRLPDGQWALSTDDMIVELSLLGSVGSVAVVRNTRFSGYSFAAVPDSCFNGGGRFDSDFLDNNRPVGLSRGESRMDDFLDDLSRRRSFSRVMPVLRVLLENYIETGPKSKVDIGPVNTMVTGNFIDGLRTRLGFQTTANLNSHVFAKGYYARGWRSCNDYYCAELTYSLNPKNYLPNEFPIRSVSLSSAYDVCAPADKFLSTDKDNVFTALKWTRADRMMFYRRQQLTFQREDAFGLLSTFSLKKEKNEACGSLRFAQLSTGIAVPLNTTELRLSFRFAPGEKTVSTKQRRRPLNSETPVLTLSHAMGLKGVLGGDCLYNMTEFSLSNRFWLKSWGSIDLFIKACAQWNRVPFPLLCLPVANLSYVSQRGTFGLVDDMELLSDRSVTLMLTWDVNGKLFNRLPVVKRLGWREYIGVRTLWGTLTDKNNASLSRNSRDAVLMAFPEGSYAMDGRRPYVEIVAGVHNVFRFFHVEYVRRLSYLSLPTATKRGVRFGFSFKF